MNQEKIGLFISENRKKLNLTQQELAEKLNVSITAISKWERGLNLPDASLMQELCKILNISLTELFNGEYRNLYINNLTKTFKTKKEKIIAIDSATYKFESNNLYVIMGHSGSGKTTLLNILGTLEKQTSGEYLINEQNVLNFKDEELSNVRMKDIGFIFQNYSLDPNLKAYEQVMLPMYINKDIKNKKEKAIELLTYVNLADRINHYPKELSGGEQQRVAIARALANNPSVVLADEPTANLDEQNEEIIFELLKKIAKNDKCVIAVSHSENIIKYADYCLYMKNGKLGVYNEGE